MISVKNVIVIKIIIPVFFIFFISEHNISSTPTKNPIIDIIISDVVIYFI